MLPVSISMKDLNVSVMTDFLVAAKIASISKSVLRMNLTIVTSTVSVLILMEGENYSKIFSLVLNADFKAFIFHSDTIASALMVMREVDFPEIVQMLMSAMAHRVINLLHALILTAPLHVHVTPDSGLSEMTVLTSMNVLFLISTTVAPTLSATILSDHTLVLAKTDSKER